MKTAPALMAFLLSAFLAGGAAAQHPVKPDCKSQYLYNKQNHLSFDAGLERARATLQEIRTLHSLTVDDIVLVNCERDPAVYTYEGPIQDEKGVVVETGRYIFINQAWVNSVVGVDHTQELALYAHEFDHLKDEHFTKKKDWSVEKREIEADRFAACTVAHYNLNAWSNLRDFFIRMRPVEKGIYAGRKQTLIEAADAFRGCNGIIPPALDPKRARTEKVFITTAMQPMAAPDAKALQPLYSTVSKLAENAAQYLRPETSAPRDTWVINAGAQMFNPNVPWNEEGVGGFFSDYIKRYASDKIKNVGINRIYWIFIGVTEGNVIKSALMIIDIDSEEMEIHEPYKIHPPVLGASFTVDDSKDEAVTNIIVRGLLKFIVPKSQGLVRNQMIFPSCILRLGDKNGQLRAPIQFLGRQISDVLSGRPGDKRYQSALDECFVREGGSGEDDHWPLGRLAEFVIEVTFTLEDKAWEVRPSWDTPDKPFRSGPDRFDLADCRNQLALLIKKIDEKWDSILEIMQNHAGPK